MNRKDTIILVTGAPRCATTPVGSIIEQGLSGGMGGSMLYEPMGPTGDKRFNEEFPIPNTGAVTDDVFKSFIQDLPALRLKLKPQRRSNYHKLSLARKLLLKFTGTRTLHTLRLSRLKFWDRNLVWKDPHAALCFPAVLEEGLDVVLTIRPALAQASSYKRLNWRTNVKPIYARYKESYGADKKIEKYLKDLPDAPPPTTAAAIVWRMTNKLAEQFQDHPHLYIIRSTDLAQDEIGTYQNVFSKIGIPFDKVRKTLEARKTSNDNKVRESKKMHDFTRSIEHTNNIWKKSLTDDEIAIVNDLTADLSKRLL